MHQLRQQAQAAIVRREVDASRTTHQAILNGHLTSEDAVRQQPDLSEERAASLARLTWQDPDYNPATLTKLRTAVRAFHPGSDRDHAKYDALQTQIESTVPKSMQPALADELHEAWQARGQTNSPAAALRDQQAGYFRKIDSALQFGRSEEDADLTGIKAEFMKAEITRFMQANPQARPVEIKDRLKSLLQDDGMVARASTRLRDRSVTISQ